MILAFFNLGIVELVWVALAFVLIIAMGNYGKHTALGYWGSILIALLGTPLIAFIVITILRNKKVA